MEQDREEEKVVVVVAQECVDKCVRLMSVGLCECLSSHAGEIEKESQLTKARLAVGTSHVAWVLPSGRR